MGSGQEFWYITIPGPTKCLDIREMNRVHALACKFSCILARILLHQPQKYVATYSLGGIKWGGWSGLWMVSGCLPTSCPDGRWLKATRRPPTGCLSSWRAVWGCTKPQKVSSEKALAFLGDFLEGVCVQHSILHLDAGGMLGIHTSLCKQPAIPWTAGIACQCSSVLWGQGMQTPDRSTLRAVSFQLL